MIRFRRGRAAAFLLVLTISLLAAGGAPAFQGQGCGEGTCADCHSLTREEAEAVLGNLVDGVTGVTLSRVPGLWALDVEKGGKKIPVYLDFSKRFLVSGDVVELATHESVTRERYAALNRVDVSRIPLENAIVIGDPAAPTKVVVFDDPECPYCKKLHPEMKEIVARHRDIAFFVVLYPLKSHPDARRKAEAILCARSAAMLEASLEGKPIPDPTCETDQVDRNLALAESLGIRSTPTLVLPDGRVMPGYKPADKILELLGEASGKPGPRR